MRAAFSEGCACVTFYRDRTDPRFYGLRFARGEHRLFRFIARWLNARGFDLIRKRAQLDGHMIGDQHQPYLRCRKPKAGVPHVYVWSGFYALWGANEDWNKDRQVTLLLEPDCFLKGQATETLIAELVVTSDGHVLARHDGDCGCNHYVGTAADLERNWLALLDAAGLTDEERAEAERLYRQAVAGHRPARAKGNGKIGQVV